MTLRGVANCNGKVVGQRAACLLNLAGRKKKKDRGVFPAKWRWSWRLTREMKVGGQLLEVWQQ